MCGAQYWTTLIGAKQHVHWILGSRVAVIQQETSVWVGSPSLDNPKKGTTICCCVKLKVVQSILPSQVSVIQQNAITSNVHSHNCMNIGPGILSPEIYESSLLVDLGIFNDKKSPHDAEWGLGAKKTVGQADFFLGHFYWVLDISIHFVWFLSNKIRTQR